VGAYKAAISSRAAAEPPHEHADQSPEPPHEQVDQSEPAQARVNLRPSAREA
jgi:hypothetical protein